MIKMSNGNSEKLRGHNSDLILKILHKTSIDYKNSNDKELFLDEYSKINSKTLNNIIPSDNTNLKKILLENFPDKNISITNNSNGSQTIFIS